MKRIITPAIFLSAQIAAGSTTAALLEEPAHDGDDDLVAKPSLDEHGPLAAWLAVRTVGRGFVVLH